MSGVEHSEKLIVLKLESSLGANTLYRALTEKHAFYSCETVRGAVTSQYIRDLKVNIVMRMIFFELFKKKITSFVNAVVDENFKKFSRSYLNTNNDEYTCIIKYNVYCVRPMIIFRCNELLNS